MFFLFKLHSVGNFTGSKAHEIVTAKGNTLELLRPDETGKIVVISSSQLFSVVRSLIPFRLAGWSCVILWFLLVFTQYYRVGANKDYVVIGSDAGKVSIVEYDADIGDWKTVHCEIFGKTGCRRIVPGQYLAADPKGRALMIGKHC